MNDVPCGYCGWLERNGHAPFCLATPRTPSPLMEQAAKGPPPIGPPMTPILRAGTCQVILNDLELKDAQAVGKARFDRVVKLRLKDPSNRAGLQELARHTQGACCEAAWAKATGEPWDRGPEGKRPDVGPYFVRSCPPNARNLLLHYAHPRLPEPPSPDHPGVYVLGIGEDHRWEFAGWASFPKILSRAVFDPPKRTSTTPCYWVDRSDLEPMETIPEPEEAFQELDFKDQDFLRAAMEAKP